MSKGEWADGATVFVPDEREAYLPKCAAHASSPPPPPPPPRPTPPPPPVLSLHPPHLPQREEPKTCSLSQAPPPECVCVRVACRVRARVCCVLQARRPMPWLW